MDLGGQHLVSGVITQGRHEPSQTTSSTEGSWVTSYHVQYSLDCEQWNYVLDAIGLNRVSSSQRSLVRGHLTVVTCQGVTG